MSVITERFRCMTDPMHLYDWSARGYCYLFNDVQGDLKCVHAQHGLQKFQVQQILRPLRRLQTTLA